MLIGVDATKVQDFLRDDIPGFREEYSKAEHHASPGWGTLTVTHRGTGAC